MFIHLSRVLLFFSLSFTNCCFACEGMSTVQKIVRAISSVPLYLFKTPEFGRAFRLGLKDPNLSKSDVFELSIEHLGSLVSLSRRSVDGEVREVGSGFFIGQSGDYLIGLTNSHVVKRDQSLLVKPADMFLSKLGDNLTFPNTEAQVILRWHDDTWLFSVNTHRDVAVFVVSRSSLGTWAGNVRPFSIRVPQELSLSTIARVYHNSFAHGYLLHKQQGEFSIVHAVTRPGDSGSPVLNFFEGNPYVFGIHGYSYPTFACGLGCFLDSQLASQMLATLDSPNLPKRRFQLVSYDSQMIDAVKVVLGQIY